MNRTEAIKRIDAAHDEWIEMLRIGICPRCERTVTWQEELESEVPADRLAAHHRTRQLLEQKPKRFMTWNITHREDCTFIAKYNEVGTLAQRFGIALGRFEIVVPINETEMMTDAVELRIDRVGPDGTF